MMRNGPTILQDPMAVTKNSELRDVEGASTGVAASDDIKRNSDMFLSNHRMFAHYSREKLSHMR
jgi:hypothetical protein